VKNYNNSADVNFCIGEEIVDSKSIDLSTKEVAKIGFQTKPKVGIHQVSIGDIIPLTVEVYPFYSVESLNMICAHTHRGQRGSANLTLIRKINDRYTITAGGTDFLHAEDSYGAIYLKGVIRGNFVATLKIVEFKGPVNPWYRVGIFVRNDISKSVRNRAWKFGFSPNLHTPNFPASSGMNLAMIVCTKQATDRYTKV